MATSSTRSRRKPAARVSARCVVQELCAIKETPIVTPEELALASGDRITSAAAMQAALGLVDDLRREAQQIDTIRARLLDLPSSQPPRRALLL